VASPDHTLCTDYQDRDHKTSRGYLYKLLKATDVEVFNKNGM